MNIAEFQRNMKDAYLEKDAKRGVMGTYAWLVEEVGELSRALRKGDDVALSEEFADVLAWLVSLANLCGIDDEQAMTKYRDGCPRCRQVACTFSEKP